MSPLPDVKRSDARPLGEGRRIKTYQTNAKVNRQKLFIFEGFKPNGLQIRIQRKELRILTPVKIGFDVFSNCSYCLQLLSKYNLKNELF